MHRKAAKQIDKLTQWTGEKFLKESKTEHSDELKEFEQEVDLRRIGVERLHATCIPFHSALSKRKPSADPYSADGSSSKDKYLPGESFGLVMISHGEDIRKSGMGDRDYGAALEKYGKARCDIAMVQEEFANSMGQGYISGMEQALAIVKDYQAIRKKLDSRRLALDAASRKKSQSKKESTALDDDVRNCTARYEETEDECQSRMTVVHEGEAQQMADLTSLLDAELDYLGKYMEILGKLKADWGGGRTPTSATRPRSKSTSAVPKSSTSRAIPSRLVPARTPPSRSTKNSSDDDVPSNAGNRSRSHSNASASSSGKPKKSMVPSFGSFGKKGGSKFGLGGGKDKYGFINGDEEYLRDDEDAHDDDLGYSDEEEYERREEKSPITLAKAGRARSQSSVTTMASALRIDDRRHMAPPLRRTNTTPDSPTLRRYVKALFEFNGKAHDELTFEVGAIIEVKSEVSADWWIGEDEHGDSGLFPSSYTEPYEEPTSRQSQPPPLPTTARRPIPPPSSGTAKALPPARMSSIPPKVQDLSLTSDDEDSDVPRTAKRFTSTPMSQSSSSSSNASALANKKKPPPPPARKATTSGISTPTYGSSPSKSGSGFEPPAGVQRMLPPPVGGVSMKKTGSAGGISSPFEPSEDEVIGVADCGDCGCSE